MNPRRLRISHRWIGAAAAIWLIFLAGTGLLLQHAEQWGLDRKPVRSTTLLTAHGFAPQAWLYPVSENERQTVTVQQFGGHIYRLPLRENEWLDLPQKPVAVLAHGSQQDGQAYWLVFPGAVWLVNTGGEIIGQWDTLDGLPENIKQAAYDQKNAALWLATGQAVAVYEFRDGHLRRRTAGNGPAPEFNPQAVVATRQNRWHSEGLLSWQKLLFNWHAGLTGTAWLNDLAAIGLIYLGISGLWLFFRKRSRNRKGLIK